MHRLTTIFLICLSYFYLNNVFSKTGKGNNIPNASWMLDEHAFLTTEVLDNIILFDTTNNKIVKWKNAELKLIVVSASLAADILDKGNFITTQLYSFPGIVESILPFLKQMQKYPINNKTIFKLLKQSADYTDYINAYIEDENGFNKYPPECPDNLSRTQGFHFDNLFTYNRVHERWDSITAWVNRKGDDFKKIKGDTVKTWFALMGLILHAVQDFYCHSNWVLIHAYHNNSFDPEDIPTWEEFNDTAWTNYHKNYDTLLRKKVLNKLMQSNDRISTSEFSIDPSGELFVNGGLQTGNCHNKILDKTTCEIITCSPFPYPNADKFAWTHRHPGMRDQNDSGLIKILFSNFLSDNNEYNLAMQLAKRATLFWVRKLLSPLLIGENKLQQIFKALMNFKENTYLLEDPFTGCEIDVNKEIFTKIIGSSNQ